MKDKEPTHYEILKTMNRFATNTDRKFQAIESDIGGMKSEIGGMKADIGGMKADIGGMKADIGKIKANMVTKDHLDDKLSDLKGDLIIIMRKEDVKIRALVEILRQKNILTKEEEKKVLTMQPFPQLYV